MPPSKNLNFSTVFTDLTCTERILVALDSCEVHMDNLSRKRSQVRDYVTTSKQLLIMLTKLCNAPGLSPPELGRLEGLILALVSSFFFVPSDKAVLKSTCWLLQKVLSLYRKDALSDSVGLPAAAVAFALAVRHGDDVDSRRAGSTWLAALQSVSGVVLIEEAMMQPRRSGSATEDVGRIVGDVNALRVQECLLYESRFKVHHGRIEKLSKLLLDAGRPNDKAFVHLLRVYRGIDSVTSLSPSELEADIENADWSFHFLHRVIGYQQAWQPLIRDLSPSVDFNWLTLNRPPGEDPVPWAELLEEWSGWFDLQLTLEVTEKALAWCLIRCAQTAFLLFLRSSEYVRCLQALRLLSRYSSHLSSRELRFCAQAWTYLSVRLGGVDLGWPWEDNSSVAPLREVVELAGRSRKISTEERERCVEALSTKIDGDTEMGLFVKGCFSLITADASWISASRGLNRIDHLLTADSCFRRLFMFDIPASQDLCPQLACLALDAHLFAADGIGRAMEHAGLHGRLPRINGAFVFWREAFELAWRIGLIPWLLHFKCRFHHLFHTCEADLELGLCLKSLETAFPSTSGEPGAHVQRLTGHLKNLRRSKLTSAGLVTLEWVLELTANHDAVLNMEKMEKFVLDSLQKLEETISSDFTKVLDSDQETGKTVVQSLILPVLEKFLENEPKLPVPSSLEVHFDESSSLPQLKPLLLRRKYRKIMQALPPVGQLLASSPAIIPIAASSATDLSEHLAKLTVHNGQDLPGPKTGRRKGATQAKPRKRKPAKTAPKSVPDQDLKRDPAKNTKILESKSVPDTDLRDQVDSSIRQQLEELYAETSVHLFQPTHRDVCQRLALLARDARTATAYLLESLHVNLRTWSRLLSRRRDTEAFGSKLSTDMCFSFTPDHIAQLQKCLCASKTSLVSLHLIDGHLLATRIDPGSGPWVIHIARFHHSVYDFTSDFPKLYDDLKAAIDIQERAKHYTERRKLYDRCKEMLRSLQGVMGTWWTLLLGRPDFVDSDLELAVRSALQGLPEETVQLLLFVASAAEDSDAVSGVARQLLPPDRAAALSSALSSHFILDDDAPTLQPVVLLLDKDLHSVPFESLPSVSSRCQAMSRAPGAHYLLARSGLGHDLDPRDPVYYLIGPCGTLPKTTARLAPWFEGVPSWKGVFAKEPAVTEVLHELESNNLYIYCGHNTGSRYVGGPEGTSKLGRCPTSLLIGCSSLRLESGGPIFEPLSFGLALLLAGSPLVLGMICTVGDKEADYFTEALVRSWLKRVHPHPTVKNVTEADDVRLVKSFLFTEALVRSWLKRVHPHPTVKNVTEADDVRLAVWHSKSATVLDRGTLRTVADRSVFITAPVIYGCLV